MAYGTSSGVYIAGTVYSSILQDGGPASNSDLILQRLHCMLLMHMRIGGRGRRHTHFRKVFVGKDYGHCTDQHP